MNTKTKKRQFKNIILGGMLCFSMLGTGFVGYQFQNYNTPAVYASYKEEISLITNNTFGSTSTSTTPEGPNSWTLQNPQNNESLKTGVINTYDNVFQGKKDDYGLKTNPLYPDETLPSDTTNAFFKQLMINSPDGVGRAGYESNSFSLDANSFYSFTVYLKTFNNARASIYLDGFTNSDVVSYIENIDTNNNWVRYKLFVKTSNYNTETVKLALWLGTKDGVASEGAALFNRIEVNRFSESTFNIEYGSDNYDRILINLGGETISPVINANFDDFNISGDRNIIAGYKTLKNIQDDNLQKTKIISTATPGYNDEIDTVKGIANPLTNNSKNNAVNKNVLFMYNKEDSIQGIESSDITIEQQKFYRISVWAKSTCAIGTGATIKLVQKNVNDDDDFTAAESKLTVSTSAGSDGTFNGWTKYSFYVQGHALNDTVVNLQLWLGVEDSKTSGYVFFDDIELEEISYSNYSNGSSTSNSTKYSYNTNNDAFTIANGNFNKTITDDVAVTYPLTADSWELTTTDNNFNTKNGFSGIVNTKTTLFDEYINNITEKSGNKVTVSNPGLTPAQTGGTNTQDTVSNNILVIGNPLTTTQTYTSSSFSLAEGYNKISFYLNTQFAKYVKNSGFNIKIASSDYTIFETVNLNTESAWQTINILFNLKTATDVTLELTLNNISGFAFIDDVFLNTSSESEFNNLTKNEFNYKVNTTKESFDLYTSNNNQTVNTSFNWAGTNNTTTSPNATSGIVNATMNTQLDFPGISVKANSGDNALFIKSVDDTFYTASNKMKYTLDANAYYKISVFVKTINLSQEEKNLKYTEAEKEEDREVIPFGASIALNGYEEKFIGINTQDEGNDYVEYVFYVNPTSSLETSLELSLGATNALTSGYVFFDDVTFTTMEEATYKAAVSSITNNRTNKVLTKLTTTDTSNEEDVFNNNFDWFIIPSILLSLAIIIAIVGTAVKRFKVHKTPKIKTVYDRRKTLDVDMDRRERVELRKQIIDELKKEYNDIETEIDAINKMFEKEEEEANNRIESRKQEHEKIKQAIIIEKQQVVAKHKEKVAQINPENKSEIAKLEGEFKKQIAKLNASELAEQNIISKKDKEIEVIRIKRAKRVAALTDKQKYIQLEIERIEQEIEEIAREEEIMWNEYKRAKEEAKQRKLEYLAEKRAAKEKLKANKDGKTSNTDSSKPANETNNEQENNQNSDNNK